MSNQLSKNWTLMFAFGVLLALIAILIFIKPNSITYIVQYLLGVLLVACGITMAVVAFLPSQVNNRAFFIAFAIANIILGITFFIIKNGLVMLIGIGAIINGIGIVMESFKLKKSGNAPWLGLWITGALLTFGGIFILIFSNTISNFIGCVIGGLLLIGGVTFIIYSLTIKGKNSGSIF
jgi:uncharacterized membrane protein HdeD (DUF308 family)